LQDVRLPDRRLHDFGPHVAPRLGDLGRRELAPAISRPSAACQRSVPGRRDGRPCVRGDPDRTNRLSGAVPLKVRPVSLSSDTVGVATRDPRSAEVGGATDDRVRSAASPEGCPGSGATIAVGSTETPSRRANVGPLCQVPCLPGSIEPPSAAARWPWHAITGSSKASRSNRSPTGSAVRPRPSRRTSTTQPGRRRARSRPATRGCAAAAVPTHNRATARATRTRTARRATRARSSATGRASACWIRCAPGRPVTAGCRRRTTGHARTRAGAGGEALVRLSAGDWPSASAVSDCCGSWRAARTAAANQIVQAAGDRSSPERRV